MTATRTTPPRRSTRAAEPETIVVPAAPTGVAPIGVAPKGVAPTGAAAPRAPSHAPIASGVLTTLPGSRPGLGATPVPLPLTIHGVPALADPSGVLVLPGARALIAADLHLGKGSALAARGRMLPPYDTRETLTRLLAAVERHAPKRVVLLGDSFHDRGAGERLSADELALVVALGRGRELLWLAGNHDPEAPAAVPGERAGEAVIDGLALRHLPTPGPAPGEVAGHLHPVARVAGTAGSARRRCFACDGTRLVMPAFGAFAGGLNLRDPALGALFKPRTLVAYALGDARVYPIALARLSGD